MSIIKQKFNQDMDDYMHRRKNSSGNGLRFRMKIGRNSEEQVPDLAPKKVHVVYKKPGAFEKMFSSNYRKDMLLEKLEKEQENTKPGLTYMKGQDALTEDELEAIRKEEANLEKKRESFLSKLFIKAFKKREQQEELQDEDMPELREPELDQETIDILKMTGRWINKLDPEVKEEFKNSPDYAAYRAYLEKHNLTKKK